MSQFRTYSAKAAELSSDWHVVDATGQTLGRLASEVAVLIRGKHKPTFSPHQDGGDYVVVVNAAKIRVSGNKLADKVYYRHSQYPGGLKAVQLDKMLKTHPDRVIEHAVRGMLPDNRLGETIIKKLKVYAGPKHPHDRNIAGAVKAKEQAALAAAVEK